MTVATVQLAWASPGSDVILNDLRSPVATTMIFTYQNFVAKGKGINKSSLCTHDNSPVSRLSLGSASGIT